MDNNNNITDNEFSNIWLEVNKSTSGYLFKEKSTGKVLRPHQMLCRFYPNKEDIKKIINLNHPDYEILSSEGWDNGHIINPREYFERSI